MKLFLNLQQRRLSREQRKLRLAQPRKIRFVSNAKAREAGDWVIKNYSEVLKKLAD